MFVIQTKTTRTLCSTWRVIPKIWKSSNSAITWLTVAKQPANFVENLHLCREWGLTRKYIMGCKSRSTRPNSTKSFMTLMRRFSTGIFLKCSTKTQLNYNFNWFSLHTTILYYSTAHYQTGLHCTSQHFTSTLVLDHSTHYNTLWFTQLHFNIHHNNTFTVFLHQVWNLPVPHLAGPWCHLRPP